ncbi:DGQHR domain-containing protein [Xanthomonas campestris]|uniref:DGQHR domain-containing protein n=1 Tax=Xanthomonas campestris TaxID=339 RepID=UPI001F29BED9|nr:DGQHR domain-containing protein [Xanthomonas campestris]MCF8862700.1 DGQHR domain-containing protein [Xanthomonas campestris pv. campestris]MEB1387248.1 DGQHR domain-containing protein [Xanthomonas campestris pv. campestris]MEB1603869.1 DGQHR domain-containing protein [Xanthomonas campestris pv. campestris]MEB1666503.1 DGQHR domain-containing protein [Xanthomonas campestris pv. campestris]
MRAFDLTHANTGFFLTAVDARSLFPLCRVERVATNPEEGFQRQLDAPRARRIAKYLQERVVPGAIVLSSQAAHEPFFDSSTGFLTLSDEIGSLLVIDGQHRLFGAKLAAETKGGPNVMLPVCILTGLSLADEVQYFIDINSTAKGVPKTLRIELTKFLVKQDSTDEVRLRLFKDLNSEAESPLCGKLSAEQRGPGYLSHVPFEIAINKIIESDRMKELEYDQKKALIKNYLAGVYVNLLEAGVPEKLTQSAFFQAIFRVFDKACEGALVLRKSYKAEAFQYVFEAVLRINFEYHTGTNDEAINNLEKDLIDKLDLDKKSKISSDLF